MMLPVLMLICVVAVRAQEPCPDNLTAPPTIGVPPPFPDFRAIFGETLELPYFRHLLEEFEQEEITNSANEDYNCVCAWHYMGGIARFNDERICSSAPIDVLCPTTTTTTTTTTAPTTTASTTTPTTTTTQSTTITTASTSVITSTTPSTPSTAEQTPSTSPSSPPSPTSPPVLPPRSPGSTPQAPQPDSSTRTTAAVVPGAGDETTVAIVPSVLPRESQTKEGGIDWLPIVIGVSCVLLLVFVVGCLIFGCRKRCNRAGSPLRRKKSDMRPITEQSTDDLWSAGSRTPSMYSESGSQRFKSRTRMDARSWSDAPDTGFVDASSCEKYLVPSGREVERDDSVIMAYQPGESSTDRTLDRRTAKKKSSKKKKEANNNRLSKDTGVYYKKNNGSKNGKTSSVSSRASQKSNCSTRSERRKSAVSINIGSNRSSPIIFTTIDRRDPTMGKETMKQGISYMTYENEHISTRSSPDQMSEATLDTSLDCTLDTSFDAALDNFDSVLDDCDNKSDMKSVDSRDSAIRDWEQQNLGYSRLASILSDTGEELVSTQNAHLFAYVNPGLIMGSDVSLHNPLDPPAEFKDPSRQNSMRSQLPNLSIPVHSTPAKQLDGGDSKPQDVKPKTPSPPPMHSHKSTNTPENMAVPSAKPSNDIKLPNGPISSGLVNPAFKGSVESLAGLGDNFGTASSTGSGSNIAIVQPQRTSVKNLKAKFETSEPVDKYASLPNPKKKTKVIDSEPLNGVNEDISQFATLQRPKPGRKAVPPPAAIHTSFLHSKQNGHIPNGHVPLQTVQTVPNGSLEPEDKVQKSTGSFLWNQLNKSKPSAQVKPQLNVQETIMLENSHL